MANYCFTKSAIEGKKEVLNKVVDAINNGDGWMKNSMENLGLKFDEEEFSPRAEWYTGAQVEERDGISVLFFTQAYPWQHEDVIDGVLAKLGEHNAKIYMLMERFEDGIHATNDHEGKYFPERYRVYTEEDDGDVYFITREEALAHIRRQYKLSDDYDTIEKIQEYCDTEDLSLGFDEIEVLEKNTESNKKMNSTSKEERNHDVDCSAPDENEKLLEKVHYSIRIGRSQNTLFGACYAYNHHLYKAAMTLYEEASDIQKEWSPYDYSRYAEICYKMGEYEKALPIAIKAVELCDEYFVVYHLAQIHDALGHYEEALKYYEKVKEDSISQDNLRYAQMAADNIDIVKSKMKQS